MIPFPAGLRQQRMERVFSVGLKHAHVSGIESWSRRETHETLHTSELCCNYLDKKDSMSAKVKGKIGRSVMSDDLNFGPYSRRGSLSR